MPSADHGTDPVQAEFVIDLLEEEVAAIEAVLCVNVNFLKKVTLNAAMIG